MKKSIKNCEQVRFERKLNHLQGFVGLSNWEFGSPTFDEIKEFDRRGRELQAASFHSLGNKLKRWLKGLFSSS